MTDEPRKPQKERWQWDKHISVVTVGTIIAAIGAQSILFLWGGATYKANFENRQTNIESRLTTLEAKAQADSQSRDGEERRITVLETRSENTANTLTQIQNTVNALNSKIDLFLVRTATQRPGQN